MGDQLLTNLPQALFSMAVAAYLLTKLNASLEKLTSEVEKMNGLLTQLLFSGRVPPPDKEAPDANP